MDRVRCAAAFSSSRPICAAVSVPLAEASRFDAVEKNANLPSRVKLVRFAQSGPSFPVNKLRNLAYENSDTTHVMLLDRDIIPARSRSRVLSALASLYATVLSLPSTLLVDEKVAIVLPLFEMSHFNVLCSNWFSCDRQWARPGGLIARLHLFFSLQKYDLRMCILTNGCSNLGSSGANVAARGGLTSSST